MESLTYLKNLDIAPKKLRMLLPKIKRLTPAKASSLLYYSPERSARVFYKAIKSAMANAKQTLKVSDDLLQFKLFTVEEGQKLKRYQAGSRGSAKPYKKRYSHIKIVLEAQPEEKAAKATSSVSEKPQAKKAEAKEVKTEAAEAEVKVAKAPAKKATRKTTKKVEK